MSNITVVVLCVSAPCVCLVSAACAEEATSPAGQTAARLDQVDNILTRVESEARSHRQWNGALNLTRGAIGIPLGLYIMNRDSNFSFTGGLVLVGGSMAAGVGLLDLLVLRRPGEKLRKRFVERRTTIAGDELLAASERDWADEARAESSTRFRMGVLSLGAGTLITGVATAIGLRVIDVPSRTMDANTRTMITGLFFAFGGFIMGSGLLALLSDGPIKSSWKDYSSSNATWRLPALNISPTLGGAYVGITSSF